MKKKKGLQSLLILLSPENISQCGDNVVRKTYFFNHIFSKLIFNDEINFRKLIIWFWF